MANGDILAFGAPEIAGALITGAVLGAAAMRGFMRSPVHDEGSSVYATPDIEALEAVLEACTVNGLEPKYEITDEKTIRALMSDGHTIFNVTRPDVWEEMGHPTGAPMLRVGDPLIAAERARDVFVDRGYEADVIAPMEDQTEGKMFFVKTDALATGLLGFREHAIKMGKKPPRWNPFKVLQFARSEG